ncbi:MAG: DUF1028 domain-containing protein [Ignavibacteria bacterium]|nr:DUF1028 domain-containing protein [Ignavibacteria bacterium]MBT8380920.1 DUF1028 domain-containing protein [Ignavibacteria bacterium]MBT8391486.1 DUF1028 domain-containing protein [Ignavibacteria bacterium]NNJ54149.1 DUF1028 domain-containing protein [Ignavibacteriaceae bacterium]NNL20656.1 DUF1028 domain-containing protein [Ignavibacteriaceae bacterium]
MKLQAILVLLIGLLFITNEIYAQLFYNENPLASTYSIVARDPETGEIGVAVQSHWFSVGSIVSWGEAGVGVVATQSFVNPAFGPDGIELLKTGLTATQVVEKLIESDEGRNVRQLAILDVNGNVKSYTGKNCIPGAGHIVGENYSVQANLMLNDKVWGAMSEAFEKSKGPLAERMLAALFAAEEVGGDIRGKQSACLLVVRGESTGKVWKDRIIDLRVEDHSEPLKELERLLKVHRAYNHMNAGDLAVEHGDMELAMREYSTAEEMFPQNEEMKYWHAVTLANNGMIQEAFPMFRDVFLKNENWKTLTPRLVPIGLLNVSEEELKKILSTKE